MNDGFTGFLVGIALGVILAFAIWAGTITTVNSNWKNDVVARGLAEYQVDKKGTVSFHWLPNTNR